MLEDFNLLVSTSRLNERKACNELWYLLREAGDVSAEVEPTNISGLIVSKTNLDPVQAINTLHTILLQKPWEFKYVLKVRPIQVVVATDLEKISDTISKLVETYIKIKESFRITIKKRRCTISSSEIIDKVAEKINRKVNLDNPAKIVLIEVIGYNTGIAVIPPSSILSVERERRDI